MERSRVPSGPFSAPRTSGSQSAQRKPLSPRSPGPAHGSAQKTNACRPKHHWKCTQSMLFNSLSFLQTAQRHVVPLNVKANKDGNNLGGQGSVSVPPGPQGSFEMSQSFWSVSLSFRKILNKCLLNQSQQTNSEIAA